MSENKSCALYLGVHIAERVLAGIFNDVHVMPFGNPGYDFRCSKDYLVDVKAGCRVTYKDRDTGKDDRRRAGVG